MIEYLIYTRDTRIHDVDYLLEDPKKFMELTPYLYPKLEGRWAIAILEPPIQFAREVADGEFVPDYVKLTLYMERQAAEQLLAERPKLRVIQKTAYERYIDSLAEMKVDIKPDAARELYRRVGTHKDKLVDYIATLQEETKGSTVTVTDVRKNVPDERKTYASDVLYAFFTHSGSRWKKYNTFVDALGYEYAFYALRKYITKLIKEKDLYLKNQDTEIRYIDRIDAFKINQAFVLFNISTYKELDMCMAILDDRELLRRII